MIEIMSLKRRLQGRSGRLFATGTKIAVGRFGRRYIISTRDGREVIRSFKASKFNRYVERPKKK